MLKISLSYYRPKGTKRPMEINFSIMESHEP